MLEHLREGIAAGSAGEEAYAAFLDRLSLGDAGDGGDCEGWMAMPEARSMDLRFAGLREALSEACPAPEPASGAARARISLSRALRPRRDPAPSLTGFDRLGGEGVFAGGAWRLAFSEAARPDQRLLRLGSGRFSLYAGQFHASLERTRLGFVAGGRFYAGRSGNSGVTGPWEARSPALDGLAVGAKAGRWIAEAAGAWNRLDPRAGGSQPGSDALLYQLGFARPERVSSRNPSRRQAGGGNLAEWGLRFQVLHLRGEGGLSDGGDPADITVAGLGLEGAWGGFARWSLGLAGSRIAAPPGMPGGSRPGEPGGYAEAALSSPSPTAAKISEQIATPSASPLSGPRDAETETDAQSGRSDPEGPVSWRLEGRQATEAWANPLQSPRGILRDTAGGWILPGRGEGAAAVRACFPFAARGDWAMALRSGLEADWSYTGGLLAQSGSLGFLQRWGRRWGAWTSETGTALRWRVSGTPSAAEGAAMAGAAAMSDDAGARSPMAILGWGQALGWRQGAWKAKAAFTWKGKGYVGALPAPLSLETGRAAQAPANEGAWTVAVLTGDIRNPGSYLRADVRESWVLGRRLKAEQTIRLPWSPEGLGADLSYQLRLEAAL